VTEWSVTDVVTKRDSLDKIKIEIQGLSDSPCDSGYKLNVKSAPRYIVVSVEGENLRFIGIAIVVGAVQNFVNVANERGPPDVGTVFFAVSANDVFLAKVESGTSIISFIALNTLHQLSRERFVIKTHF
jgi:hypothetical protein